MESPQQLSFSKIRNETIVTVESNYQLHPDVINYI